MYYNYISNNYNSMSEDQTYINDAMNSNYKLMNDLNTFNLQYAKYVKCNGSNPPPIFETCYSGNLNCCTNNDIGVVGLDALKTLKGTIIYDIDKYREKGNILYGNTNTSSQFLTNQENISKTRREIEKLRSNLDVKLKEIYNIDGNIHQDHIMQYDSVMYTGILFSILATSILYYTFTKL